ncbi:MAG: pyridoxamine 5'-phosphate oxidase family protein [Bacteroidetes bacterium]|nr:pyridoxamine 5'-phosphate oxidase family protein [Bacteroidota bacterium]
MIGELTSDQIDQVMFRQIIGRIGCSDAGKLYVVPIAFAFDGNYIYAHSKEGKKIKMMRKNPEVCFQVDVIDNMAHWRSVILWGRYQELKSERERQRAMKLLMDRIGALQTGETSHSKEYSQAPQIVEKKKRAITFRIEVQEKTGRFEKP